MALAHGLRASGAPECSNYALSWIGMANTIFLVDLYSKCINLRYHDLERNKLAEPVCAARNGDDTTRPLTHGKQLFKL
jgi:hypothetical protein